MGASRNAGGQRGAPGHDDTSGGGFLVCAVTGTIAGGLCSILLQIRGFCGLRVLAKHAFHNSQMFFHMPFRLCNC